MSQPRTSRPADRGAHYDRLLVVVDSSLQAPSGVATLPPPAVVGAAEQPPPTGLARRLRLLGIALLFALGLFLRLWALGRQPINSDEAVVGLMAHEILHGHFFAFYWGQSYGGVEPYAVALVFAVLGQSSFTLALTPVLLDALTVVLVVLLGRRLFSLRVGVAAGLLYWLWSETYIWQSTLEYGFRWAALVCGLGASLLALRALDPGAPHRGWSVAGLGLLSGVGWWATPEIAYYLVPVGLLFAYRLLRREAALRAGALALGAGAFVVGSLPWWWANLRSGFASLHAGVTPDPSFLSHLKTLAQHAVPMVLGLQLWSPTNDLNGSGHWLFGVAAGEAIAVAVVLAGLVWLLALARGGRAALLVLFALAYPFLFAASPFTYYWLDGRYSLFLPPVVALLAAAGVAELGGLLARRGRPLLGGALPALLLVGALALTGWALDSRSPYPANHVRGSSSRSWTTWTSDPSSYVGRLASELEARRQRTMYAGYWVSYVLDLESRGAITASDARLVRYPPYLTRVESDPRAAWLFVTPGHRSLVALHLGNAPLLDPGCAAVGNRCLDARELGIYLQRRRIAYRSVTLGDFTLVEPAHPVDPQAVFRYFAIISKVSAP
ncbi:MAG TPA: glycosyltransferase family 39 protein [Acidimicrobiales bacterium]|nr:glycosyltransferase family 39 protein [Acidimicrobiales bacterium]